MTLLYGFNHGSDLFTMLIPCWHFFKIHRCVHQENCVLRRLPAAKGQHHSHAVHQSYTGPKQPRLKPGGATEVRGLDSRSFICWASMEQRKDESGAREVVRSGPESERREAVILDLRSTPSVRCRPPEEDEQTLIFSQPPRRNRSSQREAELCTAPFSWRWDDSHRQHVLRSKFSKQQQQTTLFAHTVNKTNVSILPP